MTLESHIEIPYPNHTGNHSVRHAGGRHYLTQEARDYRMAVYKAAVRAGLAAARLTGPLMAEFILAPPDRRARDADNLLKVVKDGLTQAGVWVDDSNKVIRETRVRWTDPMPGGAIHLTITGLEGL